MQRILLPLFLVLTLFGSGVAAQVPIVAYGQLEAMRPITICWSPAPYFFRNSNLQLQADPVANPNLAALVGQQVRIEGTYTFNMGLDPMCPLRVMVTKVTPSAARLDMVDKQVMGTPLTINIYGPANSMAFLMLGPNYEDCLPLGTWGSIFFQTAAPGGFLRVFGPFSISSAGVWTGNMPLPNDPALQYMRFRFQAAVLFPNPGFQPNIVNMMPFQLR